MTPPLFELSRRRRELAPRSAGRIGGSADHRSGLRVAGEASRDRHDDAAEAQQGVEQRLVHDLSERAVRRAVRRGLPRASSATRTSTCSAMRKRCSWPSRKRSRRGSGSGSRWCGTRRTIGMGYHYRARYEFILFFEKGKRRLNDLGDRRRHRGAADSRRLSGGEAGRRSSEVLIGQSSAAGRARGRSVHGVRQRRRRRGRARAALSSATT